MADLPPYVRTFSFAGYQANKPADPVPGLQIDKELDDIAIRLKLYGKTAYELAVLNGFTGSIGAWLLSLVGPRGPIGPVGPIGPIGPPGINGEAVAYGTAGAAVPAHSAVRTSGGQILLARCDDLSHFGRVVGVSATLASAAGQPLTYVAGGQMSEPSWQWSDGPVFLGVNGALTQTPPTSGFIQQMGIATSATQIMVDMHPPIAIS